jgi:hypothetical protein
MAIVQVASASPVAARSNQLDASEDARLKARISVTAYRTSVGRILTELARTSGVTARAGSVAVRNEPLHLFVKSRPLDAVLSAIAEVFEWGDAPTRGWFWARRPKEGVSEYELYQDLPTQKLPEEMRTRDRRLFAADLADEIRNYRKPARPDLNLSAIDVVRALPPAAIQSALTGKRVALPWAQLSDAQRDVARVVLGGAGGAGEDTRIEVSLQGDGNLLNLYVFFAKQGRGGAGIRFQPYQFHARTPETREVYLLGPTASSTRYTGLAARSITLDKKELEEWGKLRTLPMLLALLAKKSGADLVCDDYDYGVYWARGSRAPAGEPLGFWLDALTSGVRTSHRKNGCRLEWRESNGFILLRNADWMTDDALRPPPDVVAFLRGVRAREGRKLLTLDEAARLRMRLGPHELGALARAGLLPQAQLGGLDRIARLLEIVTPAQRTRLFSPRGLSMVELSPGQRAAASAERPGTDAIFSEWVLRNQQGGDMIVALKALADGYEWRERCPQREEAVLRMDLRLPDLDPEVLRVTRDE